MFSTFHVCFLAFLTIGAESRTFTGTIFTDNWFRLWVNGKEVATDPVTFTPHQAVSFTFEDGK